MKELYKVRKITLSLLNRTSCAPHKEIKCEYGMIVEKEGVLFLETHFFTKEDLANFEFKTLGLLASARMQSFDGVNIEASNLAFVARKGTKVTFKCCDYITVYEENGIFSCQDFAGVRILPNQLLSVDFWGLDLIVPPDAPTELIVYDTPFRMQLERSDGNDMMYVLFHYKQEGTHNTLTEDIFQLFRDSLVGYLSLINGAEVQITKEEYGSFLKLFSYNQIENISCSYYACGNAKVFRPFPILFEFDNYVRWNNLLDLNKYVRHLCTAQQVLDYDDRAFILILAFEGLCKKYLETHSKTFIRKNIVLKDDFEVIKTKLNDVLKRHEGISSEDCKRLEDKINGLNDFNWATAKFRLILDELGIERTPEVNKLIREVRSTLVHEAELKDFLDYIMLSELIREIILRLINSKVDRHSDFVEQKIIGNIQHLSFADYVATYNLNVENPLPERFSVFNRSNPKLPLRLTCNQNQETV